MQLKNLELNQAGKIVQVNCNPKLNKRLLDLGFVKNAKITPILKSPFGNIRAYYIKDTLLAIRDSETQNITIEKSD